MKQYSVEILSGAADDFKKLDKAIGQRILNKIKWLSKNFDYITPLPLTSDFKNMYKLRVGDWRAIYTVDMREKILKIHMVGHRRDVYK
jgi:mRNA interferase RelE/StbE